MSDIFDILKQPGDDEELSGDDSLGLNDMDHSTGLFAELELSDDEADTININAENTPSHEDVGSISLGCYCSGGCSLICQDSCGGSCTGSCSVSCSGSCSSSCVGGNY